VVLDHNQTEMKVIGRNILSAILWGTFASSIGVHCATVQGGGALRPAHAVLKSPITYITDCKDENGKGRCVRLNSSSAIDSLPAT
jgi:hypothetical protein